MPRPLLILLALLMLGLAGVGAATILLARGGTLEIRADEEVRIFLNGLPQGEMRDELRLKLRRGRYQLAVEAEGKVPFEKTIEIRPNKRIFFDLSLIPLPSSRELATGVLAILPTREPDRLLILHKDGKIERISAIAAEAAEPLASLEPTPTIVAASPELFLIRQGDEPDLFLLDLSRPDLGPSKKSLGREFGRAVFSKNGSFLIVHDKARGALFKVSRGGEERTFLAKIAFEEPKLALSPDDRTVAVLPQSRRYHENNVYLLNLETKAVEKITEGGRLTDLRFLEDGRLLLFPYHRVPQTPIYSRLAILDLKTRKVSAVAGTLHAFPDQVVEADRKLYIFGEKAVRVDLRSGEVVRFVWKGSPSMLRQVQLRPDRRAILALSPEGVLLNLDLALTSYEEP